MGSWAQVQGCEEGPGLHPNIHDGNSRAPGRPGSRLGVETRARLEAFSFAHMCVQTHAYSLSISLYLFSSTFPGQCWRLMGLIGNRVRGGILWEWALGCCLTPYSGTQRCQLQGAPGGIPGGLASMLTADVHDRWCQRSREAARTRHTGTAASDIRTQKDQLEPSPGLHGPGNGSPRKGSQLTARD